MTQLSVIYCSLTTRSLLFQEFIHIVVNPLQQDIFKFFSKYFLFEFYFLGESRCLSCYRNISLFFWLIPFLELTFSFVSVLFHLLLHFNNATSNNNNNVYLYDNENGGRKPTRALRRPRLYTSIIKSLPLTFYSTV